MAAPTRGLNLCGLVSCAAVGALIGRPFCPMRFGRLSAVRQFYFRRAADGRPYEKAPSVRIAFWRTVGAIGRPLCPLRSGRLSANRQFYFRRAAGGRPYERAQSVRLGFLCRRRGAHWAPVLPYAFRSAFRSPAILFSAGGRWPPLREGSICAGCFPVPSLRGEIALLKGQRRKGEKGNPSGCFSKKAPRWVIIVSAAACRLCYGVSCKGPGVSGA